MAKKRMMPLHVIHSLLDINWFKHFWLVHYLSTSLCEERVYLSC